MMRFLRYVAALGAAVMGLAVGQAQEPAATLGAPDVTPARYVRIDDEWFDIGGTPKVSESLTARPQGATVDSDFLSGNVKYNGWEAGVIPIEFDANISQTRRDQFMRICNTTWGGAASVLCVTHTSQFGFLRVTQLDNQPGIASSCYGSIGQARRLVEYQLNLGSPCWNERDITHELGHAFGFIHEHQRPDRDSYILVDTANVTADALANFTRMPLFDPLGQ